ncbi:hypothetical protein BJX66DRAFT_305158, partial [Aspergillus keveii]
MVAGIPAFYSSEDSRVRVAVLSCLFPGAGFLAVGGIVGIIGLGLSVALLPFSIFAWFSAGSLAFVLSNWIFPALIAISIAKSSVWEPAGPITILFVSVLFIALVFGGRQRHASSLKLRERSECSAGQGVLSRPSSCPLEP